MNAFLTLLCALAFFGQNPREAKPHDDPISLQNSNQAPKAADRAPNNPPIAASPKADQAEIAPRAITIPMNKNFEVEIDDLITRIGKSLEIPIDSNPVPVRLPVVGIDGKLTKTLLRETLGEAVDFHVDNRSGSIVIDLGADALGLDRKAKIAAGIRSLAERARRERKAIEERFGMRARPSFHPNDPDRPTICLIHGLNSTSNVFVHMIKPLEAAGFGIVLYDYPYNHDLDETVQSFRRDWLAFRQKTGERSAWSVVAHSMGGLLIRSYIEDSARLRPRDVDDVVLIAPPNRGSAIAKAQTILHYLDKVKAVNGLRRDVLFQLSETLGAAAVDLTPGSRFLTRLNSRRRAADVDYHILAGDSGFVSIDSRRKIESRIETLAQSPGILRVLTLVATNEVRAWLDVVTETYGDGCVSLESAKLEGVDDFVVLHANHVELIRAPLFFPDPGPVVSLPYILKRLDKTSKHASN
jgi:pimeloyl-ACP methyl ester carboxylesterase